MSYRKKHVKNKIHKIRPKKSIFKRPIFWICILFVIILSTAVYFLLFFPNFQIANIAIFGNEKVSYEDIYNIAENNVNKKIIGISSWELRTKSIFLVNKETIKKQIFKISPLIQDVTIEKNFPQSLSIQIKERKPVAVFCGQNYEKCFYIDNTGVIFEQLQNIPENMIVVRQVLNNNEIFTGENAIGNNIMNLISKVDSDLKENYQVNVKEAIVSTPYRLDIKTSENWQIYFNINSASDSDAKIQLAKLNLLLKQQITPEIRQTLEYIDLRFKDRAYYK